MVLSISGVQKRFTGWLWIAGSVLILAVGILIAKMYKR